LPTTLAGVQVNIGGSPAPLLYVSDTQINAVVPLGLTSPSTVKLSVTRDGVPLSDFRVVVDAVAPQIFRNADGSAAALNQDGTINSASQPAAPGSIVSIWATGTGVFSGVDGQKVTSASLFICSCAIGIGVDSLIVSYAGTAPGLVTGVTQINFQIPLQSDAGTVEYFSLRVDAQSSSQTFIYVTR
jgi:uncharacterized protein (TIGR03437 family)